jgi:hypothetical protein
MSAEQGTIDWMTIIDEHHEEHGTDAPLVLQPSEVHRLREDLRSAYSALEYRERVLTQWDEYVKRYNSALDRALALAEGHKAHSAKMFDIANRAIGSLKDTGYTTRPNRPADYPEEETLAEFSRRA